MRQVLIVDDSAMIRHVVGSELESAGYQVVTAVDGIDGLRKLASGEHPAAIVCDVRMPRMDGFEFLAAILDQGIYSGPIVMLTTESGPDRVARAKSLGARGWLSKPVKLDLLLSMLGELTT